MENGALLNSCLYVDRVSKNEKRKAPKYESNMVSFSTEYICLLTKRKRDW